MPYRQPILHGNQNLSTMKSVPYSYQQEPIPMMISSRQQFEPIPIVPQYKDHSIAHSNSFKTNRVAPQQSDFNPYSQPNNSFRTPSSLPSTKPFMQPRQPYSMKPQVIDTVYPYNSNPSYLQNNYMENSFPDDDLQQNDEKSWCSQRLCLGLTRLTGGFLFGTMIILGAGSVGGLIASVVLYIQEPNVNSQWKVLGIVVCSIMIVTVFITLCIFIYCYKNDRIGNNNNKNSFLTSQYNQQIDLDRLNNYNQSYAVSSLPYGMVQNMSPLSTYEDVIQVEDKQTNTEVTMAPLRPRDSQRGVWPAINAYGGLSYRPLEKPRTTHRYIQTVSSELDHTGLQTQSNSVNTAPKTIIRLTENHAQRDEEQYPTRFIDVKPNHEVIERVVEKPKHRFAEEYVEFTELPKHRDRVRIGNGRHKDKYKKVSIKHIKTADEPYTIGDEFKTDHFYQ